MSLLLLFSQGVVANASATEDNDSLVATAAVSVAATAAITEASDSIASTAAVLVQTTAALTEADDSLAATATILVQASATLSEEDDSLAATATVATVSTATLSVTEDDDSLVATAAVSGVSSDAQGGTVGGGSGSRSTGGSPDRELRRYIQKLREAHEAGEVFARLNAVSIDTLSATALVGKSAMVSAKASNPRHDDEEAIMVLLLAA